MARKQSSVLTDAELRPMDILWQRGPATVAEVTAALSESGILSYSTVLTTLRILERKGYVHHTKEGQAFVLPSGGSADSGTKKCVRESPQSVF